MTATRQPSLPQIRNRKPAGYDDGALLGCWLPADTPFGNLQHVYTTILLRVDEANRKIATAFAQWQRVPGSMPPNAGSRHRLDLEGAVLMLRRAADEIVALHAVLSHLEARGCYPERIASDCVAALLKHGAALDAAPFDAHRALLRTLGEIGNAARHVLADSGPVTACGHEPVICALGLRRGGGSAGPKLFHIPMRALVEDFDRFYADAMAWLSAWSERHQRKSAA